MMMLIIRVICLRLSNAICGSNFGWENVSDRTIYDFEHLVKCILSLTFLNSSMVLP